MSTDEIDELSSKRICCDCIGEQYLSQEVKSEGESGSCSYCGSVGPCYSVELLADRIEEAFEDHYRRTSDQPNSWQQSLLSDRESEYDWERDGYPVLDAIEGAAEIPSEAASDVQAILDERHSDIEAAKMGEETEFGSQTYYEEKGTNIHRWLEEWRYFDHSLRTEARFFSRTAATHLTAVFGGIDKLKTANRRPLLVNAGPGRALDHLYRARVFQSNEKLEEALCRPDLHLGSPPARLASAGRMNARGISVFYGATAVKTAIAEVRPPVGSKVAVAKFAITRNLRLLNLTALDKVQDGGSIFDPSLKDRLERVAFLQSLGERMTRAVMPDDEAFEYLSTQAIADFLATENDPAVDGIIFQSVQAKNARNVVLFHHAARVEEMDIPEGAEIEAHSGYGTEDGWETEYRVTEALPEPSSATARVEEWPHLPFGPPSASSGPWDGREAALQVDPASVAVHLVNWVDYRCTTHEVTRHRFEKRDRKF